MKLFKRKKNDDEVTLNYIKAQLKTVGRRMGDIDERINAFEDFFNGAYGKLRDQIVAVDKKFDKKPKSKRRKR